MAKAPKMAKCERCKNVVESRTLRYVRDRLVARVRWCVDCRKATDGYRYPPSVWGR